MASLLSPARLIFPKLAVEPSHSPPSSLPHPHPSLLFLPAPPFLRPHSSLSFLARALDLNHSSLPLKHPPYATPHHADIDFDDLHSFYEHDSRPASRPLTWESRRRHSDSQATDDLPLKGDHRRRFRSQHVGGERTGNANREAAQHTLQQNAARRERYDSVWQDNRILGWHDSRKPPWEPGRSQREERTSELQNRVPWQAERNHSIASRGATTSWQKEGAFYREAQTVHPVGDAYLSHSSSLNVASPFLRDRRDGRWPQIETKDFASNEEVRSRCVESEERNGVEPVVNPNSAITQIIDKLQSIKERNTKAQESMVTSYHQRQITDSLQLPIPSDYVGNGDILHQLVTDPDRQHIGTKFPWEIEQAQDLTVKTGQAAKHLTLAELTIPGPELRRLRILSLHLKQRVKIGKSGVSKDLVKSIHERWRTCEVVKVKVEGPSSGNMKKTLETLEQKTGGLVIWKAGTVAVLYRGQDFGRPVAEIVDDLLAKKMEMISTANRQPSLAEADKENAQDSSTNDMSNGTNVNAIKSKRLRPELDKLEEYMKEMDDILAELGPRYEEWTGSKPVPVDADLLPRAIPDFTPPFRVLPYGVKPGLNNIHATHLRRISNPLSPHFVLGRDRDLHGLAAAMVKLWEKSEIAKIGFKRGILNTNQERISEEIKQLTGGSLLCRDKNSATFFRGKDFLPEDIASALRERDVMSQALKDEEERARSDRSIVVHQNTGVHDAKPSWTQMMDPEEQIRLRKEAARLRRSQVVNYLERKIQMALKKREKAEKELEKVEELLKPVDPPADRETLTEEERFMFKKLGLRMKAFLLVGRRGVFSGVVQNMHLHWKHRELVKIIIKERDPVQLKETATMLANESGGILVAVEKTSKGYAIIVYRGKNYARPPQLRPTNLLTKRLALKRHVEMQRRVSLSKHIRALEEEIVYLRAGLSKMNKERSENGELEVSDVVPDNCENLSENQLNRTLSSKQPSVTHMENNDQCMEQDDETVAAFSEDEYSGFSDEDEHHEISRRKLWRLSQMGPIYRAERLSLSERHCLRNEVESMTKTVQFLVGRSKPLSKVAQAIRLYFLDHAFVKIGVRGRPAGTSVQDIAEELEDLTGGTVYAQDVIKIILYRGWPSGMAMPTCDLYNVLTPEQCSVLEEEEEDESLNRSDEIVDEGMHDEDEMVYEGMYDEDDMVDEGIYDENNDGERVPSVNNENEGWGISDEELDS